MVESTRSRWPEQLSSRGASRLCPKCLWTFLLCLPMDLLLLETASRLAPSQTKGRAVTYDWIHSMQHSVLCTSGMKWKLIHRWTGSCARWLQHSVTLTKQPELWSCAIDTGCLFVFTQNVNSYYFSFLSFFNHCTVISQKALTSAFDRDWWTLQRGSHNFPFVSIWYKTLDFVYELGNITFWFHALLGV